MINGYSQIYNFICILITSGLHNIIHNITHIITAQPYFKSAAQRRNTITINTNMKYKFHVT